MTLAIGPLQGKATRYHYDSMDQRIGLIDRDNHYTAYQYDALQHLITEEWIGGGNAFHYTYDKAGHLLSAVDQFSSLTFSYDQRDRLASVDNLGTSDVPQVRLNYAYDQVGNLLSTTDAINGVTAGTTDYLYDALNRATRITQAGSGVIAKRVDLGYTDIGQFSSITRYSDLAGIARVANTAFSYDQGNRLTDMTHRNSATAVLDKFALQYDVANRITRVTDSDGVTDYSYDRDDRLTGANHASMGIPDEAYQYDANGNRLSSQLHGTGYQTGSGNRLATDGVYNYVYDDRGNLLHELGFP
jgi:YD repeat-containing protein